MLFVIRYASYFPGIFLGVVFQGSGFMDGKEKIRHNVSVIHVSTAGTRYPTYII